MDSGHHSIRTQRKSCLGSTTAGNPTQDCGGTKFLSAHVDRVRAIGVEARHLRRFRDALPPKTMVEALVDRLEVYVWRK